MATVLVKFDGGDVSVVTGEEPPQPTVPIENPTPTGALTNEAFVFAAGVHCFGLETAIPHEPLFQVVNVVDGKENKLEFEAV
jgi:hypothetical protein